MREVKYKEWEKLKENGYTGQWDRETWNLRNGDFPEEWIGRKTLMMQNSHSETVLWTEGVHFEVMPEKMLTGLEIENLVRESNEESLTFKCRQQQFLEIFENSQGEFEYNLFKKDGNGKYQLSDGGSFESLEGIEEEIDIVRLSDYTILTVYDPEFTGLDDTLIEYNYENKETGKIENGYKFIPKEAVNEMELESESEFLIYLEENGVREKVNLYEQSALMQYCVDMTRDAESCMGFIKKENLLENGFTEKDVETLEKEVNQLGIEDIIQIYDDEITVHASIHEIFDFSRDEEPVLEIHPMNLEDRIKEVSELAKMKNTTQKDNVDKEIIK